MSQHSPSAPTIEEIELTPLGVRGELQITDEVGRGSETEPRFARYAMVLTTVVLPLLVAIIYFFIVASDRYVSEARFIVRSAAGNGMGGVTAMIENQGLSRATDETYAVNDYVVSRDIVDLLTRNNGLRQILSRPEADFLNRYPNFYSRDNGENLFERYKNMVDAQIDGATGISTVKVVAFRPSDAHLIADAILNYAEALINRLNERAYADAERYAQAIVDKERDHVAAIETQFTTFRNASGSVDPGQEAGAGFELIGKMTTELVILEAGLQQQLAVAPNSPSIPAMRETARSYRDQIDKQRSSIVGNNRSLATKLAGFEKLGLERELAARSLGLAMVNLSKAREDAQQQHLYLQTIVAPNVADDFEYPRRFLGMLIVFAASMAIYVIARSLRSIALEHRS